MFEINYEKIEDRTDGVYTRVLLLGASANTSDPIHLSLHIVNLANKPIYEALSYCWGDEKDKLLVFCDGQPFPVTQNLESALRQLRLPNEDRVLWVDALCINQADLSERAYQVDHMREVYRMAARVVIWLGNDDDDSHLVLPLCERMVENRLDLLTDNADINNSEFLWGRNKDKIVKQKLAEARRRREVPERQDAESQDDYPVKDGDANTESGELDDPDATKEETSAFLRLITRPWFTRCWVLQEVALADEAIVVCGTQCISWEVFYCGFALAILLGDGAITGRPDQLLNGGLVPMMMMRQRVHQSETETDRIDLLWLLYQVFPLHATDPRDKVYSILGLITEEETKMSNLKPDYTISVEECYKRAALAIMSYTKNLDFLLTDRPTRSTLNTPSWVVDWTLKDDPAPARLVDEDLDTTKDSPIRPFCASSTSDQWELTTKPSNPDILIVSGFVFDRIAQLEDTLVVPQLGQVAINDMAKSVGTFTTFWGSLFTGLGSYFDTLVKWEKLAFSGPYSKTYPTGEDTEYVFAITMCAGNINPKTALPEYKKWRKMLRGPKKLSVLKGVGMKGGFYKSLVAATGMFSGRAELGDRVYATATETTLYRKLARTEQGYLAVVPSRTVVGDEVALLKGGKTPFVIRGSGGQKVLVGPGYVHGIMYGEVWNEALAKEMEIS